MSINQISFFYCPSKIFMGTGSHQKIEEIIKDWGKKRLFLTVDGALLESEIVTNVKDLLDRNGIGFSIFSDIEADPSAATVEKAFEICKNDKAEALISIGGGSAIDVAKAVGILATNGGRIHDYEGIKKFSIPPLPLIAIPTTAGTGSEVSGSCVITDTEKDLKMSIRHATLNPADVAILDPIGLQTLPGTVAAHSGMDAFVHAFESYLSRNANPITDGINLYAMELISQNIRQFTANRQNMEAGINMLMGSCLAGMTFGQTGLGNVHCMARFVGAFFHISHGLSNAICLPHAAKFNLLANPAKYARAAVAMGVNTTGLSEMESAEKGLSAVIKLGTDLGIPSRLRDIGATEDTLEEMARLSSTAGYNKWNPRHSTYDDFLKLFQDAF